MGYAEYIFSEIYYLKSEVIYMQLELNTSKYIFQQVVDESVIFQEETGEIIIPDTQPDIVSVVDTFSNVLLKSKEAEQGRAVVKGVLHTTVMYTAKDDGIYRIEYPVPFTIMVNKHEISSNCALSASIEVSSAEAVILNSRKVVAKINLKALITCFADSDFDLCSGVNDESVFQKTESTEIIYMSEYKEKTFVTSDDIVLDDKNSFDFEILGCEHKFKDVDYSISGRKIVIKGKVESCVYWMGLDMITPKYTKCLTDFSQVVDIDKTENAESVFINIMMTGCYCDSNVYSQKGDETSVSVEIHAVAQCEIFEKKELVILNDLYSVSGKIECEWKNVYYISEKTVNKSIVKVKEKINTGVKFSEIISARVTFGEVKAEDKNCKVNGYFTAFGYNENADILTIKNSFQVNFVCERTNGRVFVSADAVEVTISDDDLMLDCDMCFETKATDMVAMNNLKSIVFEPTVDIDELPSAVLYRVRSGDDLWELGKKYLSYCQLIKEVNKLDDDGQIEIGKMILIPRV